MLKISLKSLKVKIFRAYLVPLINCPRQIHFTLLQWFLGITQKYESCVSFNLLSPKIVLVSPKKSNCCFLWPWGSCFRDSKAFFRFFFSGDFEDCCFETTLGGNGINRLCLLPKTYCSYLWKNDIKHAFYKLQVS